MWAFSLDIPLLRIRASFIVLSPSSGFFEAPFYIIEDGVSEILELSTEFSPTFWNVNTMKCLRVVHKWTARIIFSMSWASKAAFEFLKRISCKLSVSIDIPLLLF